MEDILRDLIDQFNPRPVSIVLDINGNEITVYIDGAYYLTYYI